MRFMLQEQVSKLMGRLPTFSSNCQIKLPGQAKPVSVLRLWICVQHVTLHEK